MKKLLATLTGFVMLFSMTTTVLAADYTSETGNNPTCVYSKTYQEITDAPELIKKAINNYGRESQNVALLTADKSDTQLQVSQLLSETRYSDGTTEKEYAYTGFVFLDDAGQPMSVQRVMEEFENQHDESVYRDQVYGYQTIYTTERYDLDEYPFGDIWVRVDSVASKASFSSSGVKCTEIFQKYEVIEDYSSAYYRDNTTSSPSSNRTYT